MRGRVNNRAPIVVYTIVSHLFGGILIDDTTVQGAALALLVNMTHLVPIPWCLSALVHKGKELLEQSAQNPRLF